MKGRVSVYRGICLCVIAWGALTASAEAADINLRVANLSQDLELLSREVAILRMEVETLRRENAQLKESLASGIANEAVTRDKLIGFAKRLDQKFIDFRQEILRLNEQRNKKIVQEVNGKRAELVREVNDRFKQISAVDNGSTAASAPPVDVPEAGVLYTVKKGDTLSGIARKLNSKVVWIKSVNNILKEKSLQVDRELFVPQAN